jgi:cysteine desulfurase
MGLPPELAHGSIRISMGRQTTKEEIEYFIEKLTNTIQRVRQMSTAYQGRN